MEQALRTSQIEEPKLFGLRGSAPADADLLRLIAEPTRSAIVSLLAREQLCTCHIVAETGESQTNISNHLRLLRDAGVVTTERLGRYTYYRLQPAVLSRLGARLQALAVAAETAKRVRRPCN